MLRSRVGSRAQGTSDSAIDRRRPLRARASEWLGVQSHGRPPTYGTLTRGAYVRFATVLSVVSCDGFRRAIGVGINAVAPCVRFANEAAFDCFLLAGRYTLLEQNGLDDLLPLAEQQGISLLIGGAFNSGILATGATLGANGVVAHIGCKHTGSEAAADIRTDRRSRSRCPVSPPTRRRESSKPQARAASFLSCSRRVILF